MDGKRYHVDATGAKLAQDMSPAQSHHARARHRAARTAARSTMKSEQAPHAPAANRNVHGQEEIRESARCRASTIMSWLDRGRRRIALLSDPHRSALQATRQTIAAMCSTTAAATGCATAATVARKLQAEDGR